MANRYWVGGSGNWSDTSKWAASSGGPGGASVPTSVDNVYFDGNSDAGSAFSVQLESSGAPIACRDCIIGDGVVVSQLDQNLTFTGGSSWSIYGSLYVPATRFSKTNSGSTTFKATTPGHTITTNGVSLSGTVNSTITFDGVGGEWTLAGALTCAFLQVQAGTFNTNNFNISTGYFYSQTTSARTIRFGSSTITTSYLYEASFAFNATNLTFDAGTSHLRANCARFDGGGLTFYDVTLNYNGHVYGATVYGKNTFRDLTINVGSNSSQSVAFNEDQTIAGTLRAGSGNTNINNRITLISNKAVNNQLTPVTLAVTNADVGVGADFQSIAIAGAAAPLDLSAKYAGNMGGNSGIVFPAPKTVYWNLAGTQSWNATAWALTPGGTPNENNLPLAQDTAVIGDVGVAGQINLQHYNIGSLDCSTRTTALTLTFTGYTYVRICGDATFSASTTVSRASYEFGFTFSKIGTQLVRSNGAFLNCEVRASTQGTLRLLDDLKVSYFGLTAGVLDLNGRTLQSDTFTLEDSRQTRWEYSRYACSVTFGGGKIQFKGSSAVSASAVATAITVSFNDRSQFEVPNEQLSGTIYLVNSGASLAYWQNNKPNVSIKSPSSGVVFSFGINGYHYYGDVDFTGFYGSTAAGQSGQVIQFLGNLTLSLSMTLSAVSSNTPYFSAASGTQELRTNGKTIPWSFGISNFGSSLKLMDDLTVSAGILHGSGTLDLNGRAATVATYGTSGSAFRTLAFGSGGRLICTSSGTSFSNTGVSNFFTSGNGRIVLNSDSAKTFAGGGSSYPVLEQAGAGALTITGANSFKDITSSSTVATSITFPNTTTSVAKFSAGGKSSTSQLTLIRTGASGTFTLSYTGSGKVQTDNVVLMGCQALPANTWFAYRSTDGGGNSGWSFTLDADTDRYWVGGTRVWSDSNSWAAIPGGSPIGGGLVAALPNTKGSAYFGGESDAGSAFTVSIDVNNAVCNDFVVGDGSTVSELDQTMILAGTSAISIAGSLYLPSTKFVANYAGPVTMSATSPGKTVTMNGNVITNYQFYFKGQGGEWTLGSAVPSSGRMIGDLVLTQGTLRTAGYNISVNNLYMIDGLGFVLYAESSEIYAAGGFLMNSASTLHAGTSTLTVGSQEFHTEWNKVSASPTAFNNVVIIGSSTVSGWNTYNSLTFTVPGSGITMVAISGNHTVLGTLSISPGNTDLKKRRALTGSDSVVVSAQSVNIGVGVDFAGINASGASVPWNLSNLAAGDCGGNTNITFPAPKTVYWNLAGSQSWSENAWAAAPNGTPAVANFPLAQDTAVITELGAAGTITVNVNWTVGSLSFDESISPRTSTVTFNNPSGFSVLGDLKLCSSLILTGTGSISFSGRKAQRITSGGRTLSGGITLDSPGGSLSLQDDLAFVTERGVSLNQGALNLNGRVLTCGTFNSTGSGTRSIAFGTSKIVVTGSNGTPIYFNGHSTAFSYTGSGLFELAYSGATGTRALNLGDGGSQFTEANAPSVAVTGGSDVVSFSSYSRLKNLEFTGFTGSLSFDSVNHLYGNLKLSEGMSVASTGATYHVASETATQDITTNGVAFNLAIWKSGVGVMRLQDNLVIGASREFTLKSGGVDLNGKRLTVTKFDVSGSGVKDIQFGSGQILLSGTGTVWDASGSSNITMSAGTGKIVLIDASDTARTFIGGGLQTYPELEIGGLTGASTTTITGSNRFKRLSSTKEVAYTIVFPNSLTQVDGWAANGREGQLITLARTGTSGKFQLRYTGSGYLQPRYVSVSNSDASPANRWYALYSVNGGNNTGWVSGPPKFGQFLGFFEI